MELGGKVLVIVCEDVDLDFVVVQCVFGVFFFFGQICMSMERVFVYESVSKVFEEKFVVVVWLQEVQMGGYFVVINDVFLVKNIVLLQDVVSKGVVLLNGFVEGLKEGFRRMQCVVVKGVIFEMNIYKMEFFGLLVSLISFFFEKDVISKFGISDEFYGFWYKLIFYLVIVNDIEYGLIFVVFIIDFVKGFCMVCVIQFGVVYINSMMVYDEFVLFYGGMKVSGWGWFNGVYGFCEWVQMKSVIWKVQFIVLFVLDDRYEIYDILLWWDFVMFVFLFIYFCSLGLYVKCCL